MIVDVRIVVLDIASAVILTVDPERLLVFMFVFREAITRKEYFEGLV
jgi:hypothetical protein